MVENLNEIPHWICQRKALRRTEAWQRNYALPESAEGYEAFLGIKSYQTTPRFEYPNEMEPSHFLRELVYLPTPGPIKEYDEQHRLTDIATLARINGCLSYVGTRVHYIHNPESEISKVVLNYTPQGNLKSEVLYNKKDQIRRERQWDKNGTLVNEKTYIDGKLFEHRFLSPQGEVYTLHLLGRNSKEEKALIRDNIASKKVDWNERRTVLSEIQELRHLGHNSSAQSLRKSFHKKHKLQRPFLSRLLKKRERVID